MPLLVGQGGQLLCGFLLLCLPSLPCLRLPLPMRKRLSTMCGFLLLYLPSLPARLRQALLSYRPMTRTTCGLCRRGVQLNDSLLHY